MNTTHLSMFTVQLDFHHFCSPLLAEKPFIRLQEVERGFWVPGPWVHSDLV
jgi:hypothetical protein